MGIEYTEVLIKNSYVGRTFIRPNAKMRVSAVTLKFQPLQENFRGKRLVLIDDSIVRGNTMRQMVKLLKDHGAKEVLLQLVQHWLRPSLNILFVRFIYGLELLLFNTLVIWVSTFQREKS